MTTRCALLLMVVCLGVSTVSAEDWPGWRGPQRNGISTDGRVPVTWSPTKNIAWKTPIVGSGISNPIVWGERVFLTASDGKRLANLHVLCLDRDTGRERWHARLWGSLPTRFHGSKSSMASPSPVTDGRHVWAFFGTGDVFCLEADGGGLVWHRSLAGEYGVFENRFAASSSPLLFQDMLLMQVDHYGDSYLVSLDQRTGGNRWKVDRPGRWLSWSSPQLIQREDGGWGETPDSYEDTSLRGQGPSTATQTSWGLLGLLAVGYADHPSAERAVSFLLQRQRDDGRLDSAGTRPHEDGGCSRSLGTCDS